MWSLVSQCMNSVTQLLPVRTENVSDRHNHSMRQPTELGIRTNSSPYADGDEVGIADGSAAAATTHVVPVVHSAGTDHLATHHLFNLGPYLRHQLRLHARELT
eukprot:COSAG01_NODE_383_length_17798_cov_351.422058_7_plen_103_part_00